MAPFHRASVFFNAFVAALKEKPLVFNGITGCALCAGSDAFAQRIEEQRSLSFAAADHAWFDPRRFLAAGLIGAAFGGFVYPVAYARLDAMWSGKNFPTVLKKSLVEIATVGIFVNSVSMSSRGLLKGRNTKEVGEHVAREMPRVTLNDVRVWLPYNLIAFSFIPAVVRPTTTMLMEGSWQTYISLRSHDYVAP